MEGILISLDRENKRGKVDTRNNDIGILTTYFREISVDIQPNCSVEFDVAISKNGNPYAKFISVPDRNKALFNTEERSQ